MSFALSKTEGTFGATLLVTGCCIGAGMIGLPVLSLATGFFPSLVAMLLSYLFTTTTGLLLLEATLWFESKANLLSITQFTLGKMGKLITGALFLFLFYSVFIAYMDGGGQLFSAFLETIFQTTLPREVGILACVSFVALIIYGGMRAIDPINKLLMAGLVVAYCALVLLGLPHVDVQNLAHVNWKASLSTLPILFICFGYQNLVPSLVSYLKRNTRSLQIAIAVGNLIPLLLYALWNFVILGLLSPAHSYPSDMVTSLLQQATESLSILFASHLFSFFALITSFIAIAISFVDFFKDGLKNIAFPNRHLREFLVFSLVFAPPLVFCLLYPHVFLLALEFAGGVVAVILFGILPALIVWSGRYIKRVRGSYQVAGGKALLASILILSTLLLLLRA
jgi:tyrosine-specific transport protein